MLYALGFIAVGLAWLLPGHYFPWRSFQQEVLATSGAALIVLGALLRPPARWQAPTAAWFAAALALLPLAQWAGGRLTYFTDALLPSLYLLAFALTATAARQATEGSGARFIGGWYWTVITVAIVSSAIGLVQWLDIGIGSLPFVEVPQGTRVFANLVQPNHLASLLCLGVVAVLWCSETGRLGRVSAWLAVLLFMVVIAATRSRSAWLFAAVVLLAWVGWRRRAGVTTPMPAIAAGLVVFAALTLSIEALNSALMLSPAQAMESRLKGGTRPIHWATLWDAAWRHPWLGHGWLQVGPAQQAATLDHPPSHEWITYSHNIVLDLMVWNGAIPGLILAGLMSWWLLRRVAACRSVDGFFLLLAIGVLAGHSIVEFPLVYLYFLLPCALLVGMLDSVEPVAARAARVAPRRWQVATVWVLLLGMMAWIAIEYLRVESSAQDMAFWEARYRRATGAEEAPQPPPVRLLDSQQEFIWFRRTEARPGMSSAEVQRMKRLSERFSPPAALLKYALVAGLNGQVHEAQRALRLICHMWPASNCDEGRQSWATAQQKYPQLLSVPYPVAERAPQ